jgi:hypothetical protein
MGDMARVAAQETNASLQDLELQLLLETSGGWDKLRPKIADKATYDALIREVSAATSPNESIAQLKGRIEALGPQGMAVAKKVLELLKSIGV